MILILTENDTTPLAAKPGMTGVTVTPATDPSAPASFFGLTPRAKQATDIAETVWFRDRDGRVTVAKARTAKPGTQVSLFHAAELFGIKVTRDDQPGMHQPLDTPELLLQDIRALLKPEEMAPVWQHICSRIDALIK